LLPGLKSASFLSATRNGAFSKKTGIKTSFAFLVLNHFQQSISCGDSAVKVKKKAIFFTVSFF